MQSKIVISPAQALLILLEDTLILRSASPVSVQSQSIEHSAHSHSAFKSVLSSKSFENQIQFKQRLIKLYVLGIKNEEDRAYFYLLMSHPKLAQYEVSYDPQIIDQDPTKRYFETKLAYYTLVYDLDKINEDYLIEYSICLQNVSNYVFRKYLKSFEPEKHPTMIHEYKALYGGPYNVEYLARNEGPSDFEDLYRLLNSEQLYKPAKCPVDSLDEETCFQDFMKLENFLQKRHSFVLNSDQVKYFDQADSILYFKQVKRILIQQQLYKTKNKEVRGVFDHNEWRKMKYLFRALCYGYTTAKFPDLALSIYNQGFFEKGNRSRVDKNQIDFEEWELRETSDVDNSIHVRQSKDILLKRYAAIRSVKEFDRFGLMRNTMPLSVDDWNMFMETSRIGVPLNQLRTYEEGTWSDFAFSHWVHPFLNSISGTFLIQLRLLAQIVEIQKNSLIMNNTRYARMFTTQLLKSQSDLALYFRLFCALMIYNSGGHSWFEFLAPIELPEVKNAFETCEVFNGLDMERILLKDNEEAIQDAFCDTLIYNRHILAKQKINHELKNTDLNELLNTKLGLR